MKTFIKYKGTENLNGTFVTDDLTINLMYELIKISPKGAVVFIINDKGIEESYSSQLFE
jgi:hypothetical protein